IASNSLMPFPRFKHTTIVLQEYVAANSLNLKYLSGGPFSGILALACPCSCRNFPGEWNAGSNAATVYVQEKSMSAQQTLANLGMALLDGSITIVDLTAPLGPDTPVLYLPPDFAKNTPSFKMHEISAYDQN